MSLTSKVEQFNNDSDLVHVFAHGDKDTVIQTEGGPVPSMARLADGIQTRLNVTIEQQRVLEQRLAANSGATLVKTSSGRTVQDDLNAKASLNGSGSQAFTASRLVAYHPGNSITFEGKVNGVAPSITVDGTSDANVGLYFGTKGSGYHTFSTGSGHHITIGGNTGTVVNRLRLYGGLAGQNSTILAEGADTDPGFDFKAKGAGRSVFTSGMGVHLAVGGALPNAVNYLRVYGAPLNNAPALIAEGNEADVSMVIASKGAGEILFNNTAGTRQFAIATVPTAVNYPKTLAAPTGNGVTFAAEGTDTNVNVHLRSKGIGAVGLQSSNGGNILVAQGIANAIHYIGVNSAVAGVAPSISAAGTSANIDLLLSPKGSGVVRTSSLVVGTRQETNLDTLDGSRFFGFAGTATGAPASSGGYDAVGLQMSGAGQRTQLVLAGEADGLMLRTDDTPDGQNGWGTWRKVWDSSTLTKLSQLQNDLPQGSGAGRVFIAEYTVPSGTVSADILGLDTALYDTFEIEVRDFRPNASNSYLGAQLIFGGAVSTANYSSQSANTLSSSLRSDFQVTGADVSQGGSSPWANLTVTNAAGRLVGLESAAGYFTAAANYGGSHYVGLLVATPGTLTGIRLTWSSSRTWTEGKIRVYGIKRT